MKILGELASGIAKKLKKRRTHDEIEELESDPNFDEEYDKYTGKEMEKALALFSKGFTVAALLGVDFGLHLERDGEQEKGISHQKLLKLLKKHPKYHVFNDFPVPKGLTSTYGAHKVIQLRLKDHALIQFHEIPHAIKSLEDYIGVSSFKKKLDLNPLGFSFELPSIYYKKTIGDKHSRVTRIDIGLCDANYNSPCPVSFGEPCPYICPHKERCGYVNPKLLKENELLEFKEKSSSKPF